MDIISRIVAVCSRIVAVYSGSACCQDRVPPDRASVVGDNRPHAARGSHKPPPRPGSDASFSAAKTRNIDIYHSFSCNFHVISINTRPGLLCNMNYSISICSCGASDSDKISHVTNSPGFVYLSSYCRCRYVKYY